MKEKMLNFLNSIHLSNIERFDLDFDMVGWNRFDKNQLDMIIVKETPWDYPLLREFQDAIQNISYKYSIRFSYLQRPSFENVKNIFFDWYQTIYRLPYSLDNIRQKEECLIFEFNDENDLKKYEEIIKDFRSFLSFICYEFSIMTIIKQNNEAKRPEISKSEMKKIIKEARSEAKETIKEVKNEPTSNDRNDAFAKIQDNLRATTELVGASLLEQMKENAKIMAKERERRRLSKHGNYNIVEMIDALDTNSGNIDLVAKVFYLEEKAYGGKRKINVGISDKAGGAIFVNMYENKQVNNEVITNLLGSNVRVQGVVYYDEFLKTLAIRGHYIHLLPPDEIAPEPYPVNRVELHLHSPMSTQDAVTPMLDYCKYAKALGHKAIAITDHGCVQGFPYAQKASKETGIKVLYGCEFYMIDEKLSYIKNPSSKILNKSSYVVLDLETTGLSARYCKIIEFGAVKIEGGTEVGRMDILINPEMHIPDKITAITDISDAMVKGQPNILQALPKILDFLGDSILVTHNAQFDISFLQEACVNNGFPLLKNSIIDTVSLSRYLFPESRNHNLGSLCRNVDIKYDEESAHRADYDAHVLSEAWQAMLVILTKDNYNLTHADLEKLQTPKTLLKHIRPYHIIALAKNEQGVKDLYRLVSTSNIDYFAENPKIPRREIENNRQNLLIGSACLNGEVFRTAQYYNKEELKRVISFYDYIEVQPPENYSILWNLGDIEKEDANRYILDIIEASEELNKTVVATGDVHYLTPKEKIFRDVYISAKAVGGILHPLNPYKRSKLPEFENPDQHYRTTAEMLEAFSFVGEEKAKKIVIDNTNAIADQIESLLPVPNNHLYSPKIENCEDNLHKLCIEKAYELYGNPLPELIQKRLDTELNGIISHGYSVIYYIAHLLVKKTYEDGFIVGSRGSVGSSFTATMAGITEVNPLPPHYLCPKCHHIEWTKDTMPEYKSGYDLPEKVCPHCGEKMIHDGQDIPFETFLGFAADKTPDIDLNFPADYQSRAHNFIKEMLGEKNVFRAGTIETVAEKTAFGFARDYLERKGINLENYSKAKIQFLASGCSNVKRTTGQHPGGIVVVPAGYNVNDFTPIQWPADEVDSDWKTTHFDYDAIHETLLKFDLLGHVDPRALRKMCQMTNIDVKDIPMNDQKVLSLFSSTESLHLHHNFLGQKNGALGIPEFGTSFVNGILEKSNPKTFNDLVILSGLSHGQGVWEDNAERLIEEKIATLQEVIGCRDDIMTYLIGKGLPSNIAFAIMEDVRKGRGLKPQYLEIMKAHNIPDYYINSCNLIKYMFPKGHAVAYVTMGIRVGFFKVYYPLEYYATFFTLRCKQYDIKAMLSGEESIIKRLEELNLKKNSRVVKISPKETEQLKTLKIALEMVERGYKFENIDLYKSDATDFVVDHANNAIIPPFITLDGLGESNAISVVEARKEGEFLSKEDLSSRTKLTGTNIKDLSELGVLNNLKENNQLSLFDFEF